MTNETEKNESDKKRISGLEIVCILAVLAFDYFFIKEAISSYKTGDVFRCIGSIGLIIVLLSGCMDPINFLWFMISFTFGPIIKKPIKGIQMIILGIDFFLFILGAACKYFWPDYAVALM